MVLLILIITMNFRLKQITLVDGEGAAEIAPIGTYIDVPTSST